MKRKRKLNKKQEEQKRLKVGKRSRKEYRGRRKHKGRYLLDKRKFRRKNREKMGTKRRKIFGIASSKEKRRKGPFWRV